MIKGQVTKKKKTELILQTPLVSTESLQTVPPFIKGGSPLFHLGTETKPVKSSQTEYFNTQAFCYLKEA